MDPNIKKPSVDLKSYIEFLINSEKYKGNKDIQKVYLAQFDLKNIKELSNNIRIICESVATKKMNYTKALKNPIFNTIAQASQELNMDSYVIGGFVRDFLLQRDFKKDIDIVVIGSGIDLALKVSELLPNKP